MAFIARSSRVVVISDGQLDNKQSVRAESIIASDMSTEQILRYTDTLAIDYSQSSTSTMEHRDAVFKPLTAKRTVETASRPPLTLIGRDSRPMYLKQTNQTNDGSKYYPEPLPSVLLYETLAWEVRMPTEIHGLKGSCLVIPCSYSYYSYPPTNPRRVVWYQYVWSGYPIVYDPRYPDSVIDKFRGKTDIYRPKNSYLDCSLLIKSVNPSHNGEKLFAWIDPENIGKSTYKFYDVTSTIIVDTNPQHPIINISGGLKTGDSITVACYTLHTCPFRKPNIVLKGIEGSDKIDDVDIKTGQWKTTLTRTGVVKTESLDIECTVTHHGGITTRATKSQSAKCVHYNITIEPKQAADIIKGVDMNFTCTVHHSCQKNPPILSWNYENMSVKDGRKQLTGLNDLYAAVAVKTSPKARIPSPKSQRKSCAIEDYEDYYANMEDLKIYGNV
ncbi:sialoadhesin-like [Paramisgurnus dabryanus]|uniref:sialoadhesin-like n=1 Tax=Paramisgurnus dabryanus TaxID=90735 RepID=UPI003CCF0B0D